jgi:hypothetical protein
MSALYDNARNSFLLGTLCWSNASASASSGQLRGLLVSSGYTFSATHTKTSDVGSSNIIGSSFSSGSGIGITNIVSPVSGTSSNGVADANDTTFTAPSTTTAFNKVIITKGASGGASSTDTLVAEWDVNSTTPSGGDITIVWSNNSSTMLFKL